MCLTPVRLKTNSKYFSLNGYKKLYFDVPCGHCAECQMQKKNEWYLRNYFEALTTWNSDGYILFDTLTYDEEHLPTILDTDIAKKNMYIDAWTYRYENKSCFNYKHVQDFLKRLRISLERAGFDVDKNLRYFIASEYGHDDNYIDSRGRHRKGTKRPHYHILFYVKGDLVHDVFDTQLGPLTLAFYIQEAWIYGHSDCAFHGRSYTFNNTFGPKFIKDPNRLRGVQYYVTKYVCKDNEFEYETDMFIHNFITNRMLLKYNDDPVKFNKVKRDLKRKVDQFHRQSLGFGAQALQYAEHLETIWNEGVIRIADKEKVKKSIPVPMYYVRKLFQKCVKDSEGSLHWVWTDSGKLWKAAKIERCVSVLSQKMQDWYNNLETYCPDDFEVWRSRVDVIITGKRTFEDYARYVVYYKGCICPDGSDFDSTISDIIKGRLSADPESGEGVFVRQSDGTYKIGDYIVSSDELRYNCMVSDTTCSEFQGFDRLYQIYQISMIKWNKKLQKDYEEKQNSQKRLKSLGIKSKIKI